MSDSLFNLTGQYLALLDLAAETGEEEEQAFLDTLEGLTGEIEQKADSCAYVLTLVDSQEETLLKEKDRIDKKLNALNNHRGAIKRSIFNAMKVMGKDEIKTDLHKFKICKNGGKVGMEFDVNENDLANFPDKYKKQITVLDKEKIRAELDSGIDLSFAHLKERGEHLRMT